jgi:hypothetical protein
VIIIYSAIHPRLTARERAVAVEAAEVRIAAAPVGRIAEVEDEGKLWM